MKRSTILSVFLIILFPVFALSAAKPGRPEFVPGQLIVRVSTAVRVSSVGGAAIDHVISKYSGKVLDKRSAGNAYVSVSSIKSKPSLMLLEFPRSIDLDLIKTDLTTVPGIEYAELNYYVYADTMKVVEVAKASQALSIPSDNSGVSSINNQVIVAILDTGVDYRHKDLKDHMWINPGEINGNGLDDDNNCYVDDSCGYDFFNITKGGGDSDPMDEYGHGTHVAGIVLTAAASQRDFSNKNLDVRIMALKFLDKDGRGTQYDAAKAIYYAADNGARVINCSWGYFATSSTLYNAVAYASQKGVVIVASSGNNNWDSDQYPASFPEVLAVGAVDNNNRRAYFSNYGDYLDIVAPGMDILSTYPGDTYARMTGTSQASPYVAGVLAMLLGNSSGDSARIVTALKENAIDITDPDGDRSNLVGWDRLTGWGKVNAYGALLSILGKERLYSNQPINSTAELTISKVLNYPNPASISTQFGFELGGKSADVSIKIYDLYGKQVKELTAFPYTQGYISTPRWWDLKDENDMELPNGTYIYIVSATAVDGTKASKRQKLVILK